LALRGGEVAEAKRYLLLAGKTPGSTSLAAQGPNMALARDLLERGESAAVLQYLEECGSFWGGNRGRLAEWMALIRAGLKPDFGANVTY
jgi:glutathione S-transferase